MREVSKDTTKTKLYLINASAVVAATSLLSILLLKLFTLVMNYSVDTTSVIFFLSLGLLPFSLSVVCDALFQGREKMHYIAYSNLIASIFKVVLVLVLLVQGFSLTYLVLAFLLSHVVGLFIKWLFLLKDIGKPQFRIDLSFCIRILKSTITFLGINCVSAVMQSFNTILLSKFTSEVEVGLYNAAHQLLVPLGVLFESIAISVYPAMCRSFESGIHKLKKIMESVLEFIVVLLLPASVLLFFSAESLLLMFYGKSDFSQSAIILQIVVWAFILRVTGKVFGLALVASMNEKKTLQILTIDLISLIVLGFIFISQYGLIGSAITMVLVRIIDFVQHYIPVLRLFKKIPMGQLIWKPIAASLCMALFFYSFHEFNFILIAISASVTYVVAFLGIVIISVGGIEQLKIRYLQLWTSK